MKQLLPILILLLAPLASAQTASVTLSWLDNSTNEDGHLIERRTASTEWETVVDLPSEDSAATGRLEWTDSVPVGAIYTYRLRAYNQFGTSGYTNTAGKDTRGPDGQPAELVVTVTVDLRTQPSNTAQP